MYNYIVYPYSDDTVATQCVSYKHVSMDIRSIGEVGGGAAYM